MRVIAGSAKGRKLKTPKGLSTRPTTDKVKSAIFNIIQFDIEKRNVLDLFCGSGALGIEALSRGAKQCTFVDFDRTAIAAAQENVKFCGFEKVSNFACKSCELFIKNYTGPSFDLILLDPPYKKGYIKTTVSSLETCGILSEHAIIICEMDSSDPVLDCILGIHLLKEYHYGRTKVSVYKKDV